MNNSEERSAWHWKKIFFFYFFNHTRICKTKQCKLLLVSHVLLHCWGKNTEDILCRTLKNWDAFGDSPIWKQGIKVQSFFLLDALLSLSHRHVYWPDVGGLILEEVTKRVPVQPQLHQLQAFNLVKLTIRLQLKKMQSGAKGNWDTLSKNLI